jgi:hypothetical protein
LAFGVSPLSAKISGLNFGCYSPKGVCGGVSDTNVRVAQQPNKPRMIAAATIMMTWQRFTGRLYER